MNLNSIGLQCAALRIPRSPFFDAVRKSGLLPPDELIAFLSQNAIDDATLHLDAGTRILTRCGGVAGVQARSSEHDARQ